MDKNRLGIFALSNSNLNITILTQIQNDVTKFECHAYGFMILKRLFTY
jgi:hypothetical protein